MRKRLCAVAALFAMMLLMAFLPAFSMKTHAKEKIYSIEVSGDDYRTVYGENKPIVNLNLSVNGDSPAYAENLYPNSRWERQNPDGSWSRVGSGAFYHGTWRYQLLVRIEGSAAESYEFAEDASCWVNGQKWELDVVNNMGVACNAYFYSPVITLVQPLDSVTVSGVSPLLVGTIPSYSGLTVTSEGGASIDYASIRWLRYNGQTWVNNGSDPVVPGGNYTLRFLLNPGETALVGPNTTVTVDGRSTNTYFEESTQQLNVTCGFSAIDVPETDYVVTAGALNVRAGATPDAPRISGVSYGHVLAGREYGGWVGFDCGGQTGWVERRFLSLTDRNYVIYPGYYKVTGAGSLNVRSYPLLDSPPSNRIGGVKEGDYVLATGIRYDPATDMTWLIVDYPGPYGHQLGYVMYYKMDDYGNYTFYLEGDFDRSGPSAGSSKKGITKSPDSSFLGSMTNRFSGMYGFMRAK